MALSHWNHHYHHHHHRCSSHRPVFLNTIRSLDEQNSETAKRLIWPVYTVIQPKGHDRTLHASTVNAIIVHHTRVSVSLLFILIHVAQATHRTRWPMVVRACAIALKQNDTGHDLHLFSFYSPENYLAIIISRVLHEGVSIAFKIFDDNISNLMPSRKPRSFRSTSKLSSTFYSHYIPHMYHTLHCIVYTICFQFNFNRLQST